MPNIKYKEVIVSSIGSLLFTSFIENHASRSNIFRTHSQGQKSIIFILIGFVLKISYEISYVIFFFSGRFYLAFVAGN
jgi:hypothetical protein